MATTIKEIITYLEKTYPQADQLHIRNFADMTFGIAEKVLNQFIIGVAPSDMYNTGIQHYENRIKQELKNLTQHVKCVPWPFYGYETAEMKAVLQELAEYFGIELDSDKMIKGLKISRDGEGIYYIVVTVVQYPFAYVE